jgi:hypothetical protein
MLLKMECGLRGIPFHPRGASERAATAGEVDTSRRHNVTFLWRAPTIDNMIIIIKNRTRERTMIATSAVGAI